jgi:hypothetical protein
MDTWQELTPHELSKWQADHSRLPPVVAIDSSSSSSSALVLSSPDTQASSTTAAAATTPPLNDVFSRLLVYQSTAERNEAFFAILELLMPFFVEMNPRPEIIINFIHIWNLQDMDWMQLSLITLMLSTEALSRRVAALAEDEARITRFIRWLTPQLNEHGSRLDDINGRAFINKIRCKWIELY